MALDTAINNVGEYYAVHYLADQFSKDILEMSKKWQDEGSNSTPKKLQALSVNYYKAKTQALDFPDPQTRNLSNNDELKSWHPQLLAALGYMPEAMLLELSSEKAALPVRLRLNRHNSPWLVVLQAAFCLSDGEQDEEPLELSVDATDMNSGDTQILKSDWEHAIATLFKQEDRPRWVLFLAGSRIYLFDAHTYAQGRYIFVDLEDAYAKKDVKTFQAISALLSKETLAPDGESDEALHDKLREGSMKSTHGVSAQLQGAVREAIQLIANGWVEARRAGKMGYRQLGEQEPALPDGSREITAERLKHEALITVYRILFCLYAEARGGETGILPITDDVYRLGYSMEALRDLADRGEPGTSAEQGTYFAEHLSRLFNLIHQGFHPELTAQEIASGKDDDFWRARRPVQMDMFGSTEQQLSLGGGSKCKVQQDTANSKTFVVQPLTATLFDPVATPLMDRVKLNNRIMQQVVRKLSLGRGDNGRQIGRINYAELGIVQLGAVYEGLLSYKGFFATEDLIQVLQAPEKKKDKPQSVILDNGIDPQTPTWFVPASRKDDFKLGEIVIEHRTNQPRIYKQGEFILHLNGVDRVNSASYYTPEVLTNALVKETLKERLKDFGPNNADDILTLKICEPAMGSAAFLVEAIDQLARHYLKFKQEQIGQSIDPSNYEDELRRVRHFIAVHNVYGVDLNATAVEFGALSLWLASIHRLKIKEAENGQSEVYRPGATPWFGLRLRAGNSLIGARRAVWTEGQLTTGKFYGSDAEAPCQLKPGQQRKKGEIYHFLVWDEDMTPAAKDSLMKSFWPDECEAIKFWQSAHVKSNWTPEQLAKARAICDRIDVLWEEYAQERTEGLNKTECTSSVWPVPSGSETAIKSGPSLKQQEAVKARLEEDSGAFQRLKLLMDCWCSFYFWPLEKYESLPSRNAWLVAAEVLVGGEGVKSEASRALLDIQLGNEVDLESLFAETQQQLPDAQKLSLAVPWYHVAREVNTDQNFHHWELIFTEILGPKHDKQTTDPNGFDLMFGNPPWGKVTWNDAPLLAEFEPLLGVRDAKSAKYESERPKLLKNENLRFTYRAIFQQGAGGSVFLNDRTLYPSLAGVQTNLYKNFIERSWGLLSNKGVSGLLHPEGVYDDPKGGPFRAFYSCRLVAHYQFSNQLMWFPDIGHRNTFSINIYGNKKKQPEFNCIFNLFHPLTIDQSYSHKNKFEVIPGIKDGSGSWERRGHCSRILKITSEELSLFGNLFEDEGVSPLESRLPQVHSEAIIGVLEQFAKSPRRLGDIKDDYHTTVMFDETFAQRDGLIHREENPTFEPKCADEWIISGPHLFVATPMYQTPRTICTEKGHYDSVDLSEISESYLPRSVYRPGDVNGDLKAFNQAISEWPKPSKPGFWPIEENEVCAYEKLLGKSLKLYGLATNLPGAKTARKFAFFSEWEGPVEEAITFLLSNKCDSDSDTFRDRYSEALIKQTIPNEQQMLRLPKPFTWYPKYGVRGMCQPANERTLIGTLLHHGSMGINALRFVAFCDLNDLLRFSVLTSSILADFFIKINGRGNVTDADLKRLPLLSSPAISLAINRYLRLVCLTELYAEIWKAGYSEEAKKDQFVFDYNKPVCEADWCKLSKNWKYSYSFRTDFSRRQAQLEIDVLVALSLGLELEALSQIYNVQFSVMKAYEEADQYDIKGHRLPNTTRKDPGAKELREILKSHDGDSAVTVCWEIDNGNQKVTNTFYPPFTHVDRIEDYRVAYSIFKERLGM